MKQSIKVFGKTIDEALSSAAEKLGHDVSELEYEVITEPKKGFFGIGEVKAELLVSCDKKPEALALEFIQKLISDMQIDAKIDMTDEKGLSSLSRLQVRPQAFL